MKKLLLVCAVLIGGAVAHAGDVTTINTISPQNYPNAFLYIVRSTDVFVGTTTFSKNLGAADTNLQHAMNTIDQLNISTNSGGGSGTISTVTAGANIVITNSTGPIVTVALSSNVVISTLSVSNSASFLNVSSMTINLSTMTFPANTDLNLGYLTPSTYLAVDPSGNVISTTTPTGGGGGGGSGAVNSGTIGQMAYYSVNGSTVSGTSHLLNNTSSITVNTLLNVVIPSSTSVGEIIREAPNQRQDAPGLTADVMQILDSSGSIISRIAPNGWIYSPTLISSGPNAALITFDRNNDGNYGLLYRTGDVTWLYDNQGGNTLAMDTAGHVSIPTLNSGQCVQAGAGGLLATTGSPCGSGGGGTGGSIDWEYNGSNVVTGSTANFVPPLTLSSVGGVATIGDNSIFNQSTLQAGSTFYVSSGTVDGQLSVAKAAGEYLTINSENLSGSPVYIFNIPSNGGIQFYNGSQYPWQTYSNTFGDGLSGSNYFDSGDIGGQSGNFFRTGDPSPVTRLSLNYNGPIDMYGDQASNPVLVVHGFSGQSVDMQDWKDSSGTILDYIDQFGNLVSNKLFISSGSNAGYEFYDRNNDGKTSFVYRTGDVSYLYDSTYGNALGWDTTGKISIPQANDETSDGPISLNFRTTTENEPTQFIHDAVIDAVIPNPSSDDPQNGGGLVITASTKAFDQNDINYHQPFMALTPSNLPSTTPGSIEFFNGSVTVPELDISSSNIQATKTILVNPAGTSGEIDFGAASGGGFSGLKSSGTLSVSTTWVMPPADGTAGQVMQTDGKKNLSFVTQSGGGGGGGIVSPGTFTWVNNFGISVSTLVATSSVTFNGSLTVVSGSTQPSTFNSGIVSYAHIEVSSTTPILSSCGTSPSIVGNDQWGTITVGSVSATSCTMTFAVPWVNAPSCNIMSGTAIASPTGTTTQTAFTFGGTSLTGDVVMYQCGGYR